MPRIPLRIPPQGSDTVADAIRQRRGARGLTPLDGTLLNAPEIAAGYNQFIGAVRNKNSLPGDIREIIILRVAARNYAAFEWMHHEHVGRDEGLNTEQLAIVRDVVQPLPNVRSLPANSPLSRLQAAALAFADASTVQVRVPDRVFKDLKDALGAQEGLKTSVDQQLMECMATAMGYNGVSRLLIGLDVGDHLHDSVALPGVPYMDHAVKTSDGATLAVRTAIKEDEPNRPFLVFVNSLLTNMSMWDIVVSTLSRKYNIVVYDQRGHGKSSIPEQPATMDQLADDVAEIVSSLGLATPIHALIGVSQGGATTLNVSVRHPGLAARYVACDTQAKSPAANSGAWDERIALAKEEGMEKLADVTVPRWFPRPSEYSEPLQRCYGHVHDMVERTRLEGFIVGARALQGYEVPLDKLTATFVKGQGRKLLLIAGERDGKLPETLSKLKTDLGDSTDTTFNVIPVSGHLPMLDNPVAWTQAVSDFLSA